MKFFACSDLHLDQADNYDAFKQAFPFIEEHSAKPEQDTVLMLAGDICESLEQMEEVFRRLQQYFSTLVWVPGNHELWVRPSQQTKLSSPEKYQQLIKLCRNLGVYNPEDAFPEIYSQEQRFVIVPLFLLYDYSFRPDYIGETEAVNWAMESDILCSDEVLIKPEPYASIIDWCKDRLAYSEARIMETLQGAGGTKLILVNHFPLNEACFELKRIPRFSIWCGTRATSNWHQKFPVSKVITGHLHIPSQQILDSVEFFEVSVGYPGQWNRNDSFRESFTEISF